MGVSVGVSLPTLMRQAAYIEKEKYTMTKTIKIYQAYEKDLAKFFAGSLFGEFISVDDMELVVKFELDETKVTDDKVNTLLDMIFAYGNDDDNPLRDYLSYSLSVGDVVTIGNTTYRCTATGWSIE